MANRSRGALGRDRVLEGRDRDRREQTDKAIGKHIILKVTSYRSRKRMLMCAEISAFQTGMGGRRQRWSWRGNWRELLPFSLPLLCEAGN